MKKVTNHVCPNCGHCDCCGRGGYIPVIPFVYPIPYQLPWTRPYQPPYWYGVNTDTKVTISTNAG